MSEDTIKFNKIKAIIDKWVVDDDEHELLEKIADVIDGEEEDSFITECRNTAIKENLPLYFVYYEETGVFEVYVTKTKELFEKRHCSKHLSDYEFNYIARQYLDDYSEMVHRQLGDKE